ncbi:cation channel sperm-associated protein subunit beta [Sarcophilus harrisii]|uniref:cation channel sperm-associated protein subunit beta n=1 Tax=Sarcophilus harrisii TaxID=9305 RepID=UPI001301F2C0|nr:cation channel sperm-associated protein subunit beta [Sarcophilus harrisii]
MMGLLLLCVLILYAVMSNFPVTGRTYQNKAISKSTLSCFSSTFVDYDDLIKLYLTSEDLSIQCYFVSGLKIQENANHTIDLLTSRGLAPSLTITNSTYTGVFHFNLSSEKEDFYWTIGIPRKEITNKEDIAPVEEWFVSITLQEGLDIYTTEGTILDLIREPILQWVIGKPMKNHEMKKLVPYVIGIKLTKCPCANDVALIGLTTGGSISGIYIGLTHSGFWEDSDTVWFDVKNGICPYNDEECMISTVVGIVLTNYHLVLLTSVGLYISTDLRYPNGTLMFSRINFCGFDTSDYLQAKLWYNEICLANQEDFEDDYIAITFEKSRTMSQLATCFYSFAPFDDWKSCIPNPRERRRRKGEAQLISFLVDIEMKSGIYLFSTKIHSFVVVRKFINKSPRPELLFPSFSFPSDFHTVVGMVFHPGTHFLYVFGNQVWISYDGANTFEIVANFFDEVIIETYHSFHTLDIIFLSQTLQLYFSKAGVKSYYKIGRSRIIIFDLYYDHVGTDTIISLSKKTEDCIDIFSAFDNTTVIQVNEDNEFDTVLAPQYITAYELVFFAYVPLNATKKMKKDLRFYPRHIGRKLQLNSYGNADITKIMYHEDLVGFPSSAAATLEEPFAVEFPSVNSSLKGDITIQRHDNSFFKINLIYESRNETPVFRNTDIMKTVVIPGYSSLLIVEILNGSMALALATMPMNVFLLKKIPSTQWFLYKFGVSNDSGWFITSSSCKHALIHDDINTGRNIIKYLDLGDTFHFQIKVLSSVSYNTRVTTTPLLKIITGQPFLLDIITHAYWDETDNYVVELDILNRYLRKGITSIAFIIWQATTDCDTSTITLKVKSSCCYNKHIKFLHKYKISLDNWEEGEYQDEHGYNIIKTLPINYRPPSSLGIAIPTTDNFYHADPSKPKPRNYHPLSKKSGKYKKCLNKTSRKDCNCTTEEKMSQNIAFSDCIEKVLRFLYPVNQYPIFLDIKDGDFLVPMEPPYLITISEVNNRKNWKLSKTCGSELYHFRVKVVPGVTFCKLVAEFQIYVDHAPLPFPGRVLIASITTVLIGGIILSVFMVELFDIHIWLKIKNLILRKNKVAASSSSVNIRR